MAVRRIGEWTSKYRGTPTTFRIVLNEATKRGDYTIETKTVDSMGKPAWRKLVRWTTNTPDREQPKLTSAALAAMLDAITR